MSNVPKLRFKGFSEEWKEKTLGETVHFLDGQRKPIKESDRASMQGEYPYYGASGIIDYVNDYIFDEDLILLGEDGENIVSRNSPLVFKVSGKCWINNHAHVLKPNKPHVLDFFVQYMETLSYIKYNSGGAQPKLNQAVCKTIPLILPQPLEQQKIANCLSSIDQVITAQTQKLDTLKAHKKGLMQQLFPAEGETIPKLRFPEFRNAGHWEEDTLDKIIDVIDGDRGKNYPKSDEFFESGYCVFLSAKNVTKNGFKFEEVQFINKEKDGLLRKGKLQRADVVLTTRGSVGQFAYYSEDIPYENMRINSGMVLLRTKTKEIHSDYLYSLSMSEVLTAHIKNIAFGNAQLQLTVAEIKKFRLFYPKPKEQQKITKFLSTISKLITAQAQKVETLKAHKKGLMQQLFPSNDEET